MNGINENYVQISKIQCKMAYKNMIVKQIIPPTSESKWNFKLNISTPLDWDEIWLKANSKSMDDQDRDLWFRLRHRILPTNDVLHKMDKTPHLKCGLCKTEMENLEHLFIYCIKTLDSWLFVENILRIYTGNKRLCLNDSNRILGYGKQNV